MNIDNPNASNRINIKKSKVISYDWLFVKMKATISGNTTSPKFCKLTANPNAIPTISFGTTSIIAGQKTLANTA
jgi:hypothetical protein